MPPVGTQVLIVDNWVDSGYTYPKKEVKPMKKRDIFPLIYQLASPVLLMLLGAVLLFNPDSASALISRLLGWIMTIIGIGIGISAIADRRGAIGKGLAAVGCVCIGGWLTAHPLLLAAGIGRILGILIALRGIRDLFLARDRGYGLPLAAIVTLVGLVLAVLPMTTSRLVFSICGGVILAIGIAMLLQRLKEQKYLEGGDSNIIDAL